MRIIDVEPGDERLPRDVLPVLIQLRPHLTAESLRRIYEEGHPQGLRFTALYDDERCLAVAGWRVMATTVAGRKLYVDDLVTDGGARSRGYGHALLSYLLERAGQVACRALDLDSRLDREDAHRFYLREGLQITAHHFARSVD